MKYDNLTLHNGCRGRMATFGEREPRQHHIVLHAPAGEPFAAQLTALLDAFEEGLRSRCGGARPVMTRFHLSDAANQAEAVEARTRTGYGACRIIQQPPLDGSKIGLWALVEQGVEREELPGECLVRHNGYTHLYSALPPRVRSGIGTQCRTLLAAYDRQLERRGGTLAAAALRTWFYVQDIDARYRRFVTARREWFERHGLTAQTHFLASTGIEGRNGLGGSLLTMDAYALFGGDPQQVGYPSAPTHMGPTHRYGVTFERATSVQYGDRRELLVSGTASIDRDGNILHPGEVGRQTERVTENIGRLLASAGMEWSDAGHLVVYLRDGSDRTAVDEVLDRLVPRVPRLMVCAPVCRPGWLVEAECMACSAAGDTRYRPY